MFARIMLRKLFVGVGIVSATASMTDGKELEPANLPKEPFGIHEEFEQSDPVRFWKGDGTLKVRFKGLTDEVALHGEKSFNLDVTFSEDGEFFWRVPWGFPAVERPHLSFHLRTAELSTADEIAVGYALIFYPTDRYYGRDVCTIRGTDPPERRPQWRRGTETFGTPGHPHDAIMSEVRAGPIGRTIVGVEADDLGLVTDTYIRIKGRAGQRAILYLDELRIDGTAPDADQFRQTLRARYARAVAPLVRQMRSWRTRIQNQLAQLDAIDSLPEHLQICRQALQQQGAEQVRQLDELIDRGCVSWKEIDPAIDTVWALEHSEQGLRRLKESSQTPDLVTYRVRAMANTPVLPTQVPTVAAIGGVLEVAACRGEIEPVSFAVYALTDVDQLTIELSDLKGPSTIAASQIDPYLVKAWYQAGFYSGDPHGRFLVPDLLVKDDALVRVDYQQQQNYVRSTSESGEQQYLLCSGPQSDNLENVSPQDADTLQPVDISAGTTCQFWLTLQIPVDVVTGNYEGKVTLRWSGGKSLSLPLQLKVHSFDLPPSPLTYSTYNRSRLTDQSEPQPINSESVRVERYERELRNQVLHGILNPNSYDGLRMLRPVLEARNRAGVATDRFFCVDLSYMVHLSAGNPQKLGELKQRIKQWQTLLTEYGYDELWIMGIDEARGDKLRSQRKVIDAIHKTGVKTWAAATHATTFGIIGDMMDVCIMAGGPRKEESKKWRSVGHEVFCYGFPQSDCGEPEIYRRNYGLYLWKAGCDGAMHYAYRHGMGHVWNDFDHVRRDHTFVYPTVNGLIDTIAWEGIREGVDDTRYVAALQQAIQQASDRDLADQARRFLDEMNVVDNMDNVRAAIVQWIERLQ